MASELAQVGMLIDCAEAAWVDDTGPTAQGARLALSALRDDLALRFGARFTERETVTPEQIEWPIIPWPSDYPDRASYHKAMVGWVKTVTRIQKLSDA